jgi:hypothetical protein
MKTIQRAALLGVLAVAWLVGSVSLLAVQQQAAVTRPALTPAEMEDFLLHARISDMKGVDKGVTNSRRATLSDGRVTHDAHIQTVDISKALFQPARGPAGGVLFTETDQPAIYHMLKGEVQLAAALVDPIVAGPGSTIDVLETLAGVRP